MSGQAHTATPAPITALVLLRLLTPALVIGVFSGLLLAVVSGVAEWLADILWTVLPGALGIASYTAGWTIFMLTLVGAAEGLVVWKIPGHAGPDPATTGLVEEPLAPKTTPGLLGALILTLAGGVSLGPENPIMGVDISLVFALGRRIAPSIDAPMWVGLATAGMIGAMFGTPVAAALVLSEAGAGDSSQPLFDRLFGPLVAAGAGAVTTDALAGGALSFTLAVAPYAEPQAVDLLSGAMIAFLAAMLGLGAVYAFPVVHRAFHRIPNPLLMLLAGGMLLGVLGVIGGPITLFKGLDQMKELVQNAGSYTVGGLALVVLVKVAALLIAASSGFRGGRIFPACFAGVAFGLLANALVPVVPQGLAVACGVLGILLAITRQGWLSLFMASTVVASPPMIPVLCVALLPAWLLVTGKPPMQILEAQQESLHPADGIA
jgi:H+/Cl- antiporter ClcA